MHSLWKRIGLIALMLGMAAGTAAVAEEEPSRDSGEDAEEKNDDRSVLDEALSKWRARQEEEEAEGTAEDEERAQGGEDTREIIYTPVHTTFFPGVGLYPDARVATTVGLGIVINEVYLVGGFQASGIGSSVTGSLWGCQYAGIFNSVGGDLFGVQYAGIFNSVEGAGRGVQAAGIFNTAEAGFAGVQAAGIFNAAEAGFAGIQAAGIFNSAAGGGAGIQAAGIFNSAEGAFKGAQIGLINLAGDVTGVQVGLVNVCDSIQGAPIGLVNIIRDGIHDLTLWTDQKGYTYGGIMYGGRNVYVMIMGGGQSEDWFHNLRTLTTGLGGGYQINCGPLFAGMDGMAKLVVPGADPEEKMENLFDYSRGVFPSGRVYAGVALGDVKLYGGMSADFHLPGLTPETAFLQGDLYEGALSGQPVQMWASPFAGIRL